MKQDTSKSIDACAAHYGDQAEAMRQYLLEGERKALAMDNRGPVRFEADGSLSQDIQDAYSRHGFYVFTSVLNDEEIEDITADLEAMKTRFPSKPGSAVT